MAIQGKFSRGSIILRAEHGGATFSVKSFENNILVIDTIYCSSIYSLAKNIVDCFKNNSNLKDLKAIRFSYNGAQVSVTPDNATVEKIVELWRESIRGNVQYKSRIQKPIGYPIGIQELQFKDENAYCFWEDYVQINSEDSYGFCIIRYAKQWAEFMQYLMSKNESATVADVAEQASKDANGDALSELMRSYAIDILSKVWKYGEELQECYGKGNNYLENDDVDPEMLTISVG